MRKYISLSEPIYDEISNKVYKSYPNSCITWIEEINNNSLLQRFNKEVKNHPSYKLLKLFHGTSHDLIDTICYEGFKSEYNKVSAYGKGTYFSTSALYSSAYMKSTEYNGISYMFYCDVLTHRINNNNIYAILNNNHCVPKYVIAFYKNAN